MIIAYYALYNEAEYIEYSLKSIYDEVDKIIIIEGAFKETQEANNCSVRSTDGTIEIIEKFKENYDRENKIIIKYIESSLPQLKQRTLAFRYTSKHEDHWLWLIDGDEVYHPLEINKIKKAINETKAESLRINSYVFINDFYHYVDIKMPRLFNIKKEYDYLFVQPNMLAKHKLNETSINLWRLSEEEKEDIFFHHYSYCKSPERFLLKRKERIQQTGSFKWDIVDNKIYSPGVDIKTFNGEHPEVMRKHPKYGIK